MGDCVDVWLDKGEIADQPYRFFFCRSSESIKSICWTFACSRTDFPISQLPESTSLAAHGASLSLTQSLSPNNTLNLQLHFAPATNTTKHLRVDTLHTVPPLRGHQWAAKGLSSVCRISLRPVRNTAQQSVSSCPLLTLYTHQSE